MMINIIVEVRGAVGGEKLIYLPVTYLECTPVMASKDGKFKFLMRTTRIWRFCYVSFKISGKRVYSKLKFESGAHRVQRVPKTEASGRIHTIPRLSWSCLKPKKLMSK